jgi:predicted esterase
MFSQCEHCRKQPSSSVKVKACTGCFAVGYCSKSCQRNGWAAHKSFCRHRQRTAADDAQSGQRTTNTEVRLEVKSGDSDTWRDVGPINLVDGVERLNISGQARSLTKELSSTVKSFLCGQKYSYRHSQDGIDTNLFLLFHGAGDTHVPFDALAKKMALPQTATLALSASNVEIPFGLGYTWFEETDWGNGNSLDDNDPKRLRSLSRAVDLLMHLICFLIGVDPDDRQSGLDSVDDTAIWIPERIFLLGFSAGACLAMELCRSWMLNGRTALGGAICIAGGIKTQSLPSSNKSNNDSHLDSSATHRSKGQQATDILIIAGSRDDTYSSKSASESKQMYNTPSKVNIHIEAGKGHTMLGSKGEMRKVMEFLSKRLVRRMSLMEAKAAVNFS